MKITILTYDTPHRKTQDLLLRLAFKNYDITVISTPYTPRPVLEPFYSHRPKTCVQVKPEKLCEKLGIAFKKVEMLNKGVMGSPEYILIAGAGILAPEIVNNFRVVNSHPGYLPYTRGLDAVKWAIYNTQPVGVTLHLATPEADQGPILTQEILSPEPFDSFHSFSYRVYEKEIELLAEFEKYIDNISVESKLTNYEPNKRMGRKEEVIMHKRFERLRDK